MYKMQGQTLSTTLKNKLLEGKKPSISLKDAILALRFQKIQNINKSIEIAAITTMQKLMNGKGPLKLNPMMIARYAASLIGYYRGVLGKPRSTITRNENVDNFIKVFVAEFFFHENGRIQKIQLFKDLFGIGTLKPQQISLPNLQRTGLVRNILKFSIQKKPVHSFTETNFKELKTMSNDEIFRILNPTMRRFNPHLNAPTSKEALDHAKGLLKLLANQQNEAKKISLTALIQLLQKINTMNEYQNALKTISNMMYNSKK